MTDSRMLGIAMLIACVTPAIPAAAQPFVQKIAPFGVERAGGERYASPFSGGLLQPRIGLRDADADGDPDLFTLNPDNRLRLYRNNGGFIFRRVLSSPYDSAPVRSWFRFADIDADGDDDLFTSGALSEVLYHRNLGSATRPLFAAAADTVRRGDTIIYTQQETVPSLADIDADDDLDLFSGNIDGSISFYRNIGTRFEPRFTFVTANYQEILIVSSGGGAVKNGGPVMASASRHGASVLDFADLDRDGDLDMLFGDFFTSKLLHLHNDGTPQQAAFSMSRLDTAFRPDGDDVSSVGFNQPASGDLDLDGDLDVLVSSLYPLAPEQPVILYENVAADSNAPVMRRRSIDLTSEIDIGTHSAPAVVRDAERSGVLVGKSDGTIVYFASVDDGGKTLWKMAGLFGTRGGLFQAAPAAGDLDGDGRAEIIIGDANDGRIRLFRFDGNRLVESPWQLDTFRVNQYASPSLADIDRDDDLDLFVGAGNGLFVFFRNTGTPGAPLFERSAPPSPFNTLDVGSGSSIAFHDLDGDGDPDAIVGGRPRPDAQLGFLRFYLNENGSFSEDPRYREITTDRNPMPAILPLPEGLHLIVGTQAGGLLAYHDSSAPASAVPLFRDRAKGEIRIIENVLRRGDKTLEIAWNIPQPLSSLLLTDLLGREVARLALPDHSGPDHSGRARLPLPALPAGRYVLAGSGPIGVIIVLP